MTTTMDATSDKKMPFVIPDYLLPDVVVQFDRNVDETTPFLNDEEYFYALLACETTRYYSYKIRYDTARHIMNPMGCDDRHVIHNNSVTRSTKHDSTFDYDQYWKDMYEFYHDLYVRMNEKLKKKVLLSFDATTNKSSLLVEQFLINIECDNDWEKEIFYLFLCSCSNQIVGYPGDQYYECRIDNLYWIRHYYPRQYSTGIVSRLFDMDSKFVKEHMYQQISNQSENKLCLCKMTEGVMSIFMGCITNISVTQYQELDSVCLQETLLQCEAFQLTPAGKAILERKILDDKRMNRSNTPNEGGDNEDDNDQRMNAPLLEAMQKMDAIKTTMPLDRIYNLLAEVSRRENVIDQDGSGALEEQEQAEGIADKVDDKEERLSNDDSGELIEKDELLENDDDNTKKSDKTKTQTTKEKHNQTSDSADSDAMNEFGPYKNNLKYLEDQISLFNKIVLLNKDKNKLAHDFDNANGEYYDENYNRLTKEQHERLIKGRIDKNEKKVIKLRERIQIKLAVTKNVPRLEQLVAALELDEFERLVLLNLIKCILMPSSGCGDVVVGQTIGEAIQNFATSLEDKMLARKYFYKTSRLIKEGILCISQNDFMEDLSHCSIDLDRRMFDFLVGLDTEFSEVVDGSHLYIPNVSFDDTVLPVGIKNKILERIEKFDEIKNMYHALSIDEKITYGTGQVLLFYGASGTGKTMMANAIATKLKKKILLINFPSLGTNSSGRIIKYLFREARIQKALLFFDECESLFRTRDASRGGGSGDASVNMILTELERFNGLCILATNRPMDIDEAMHRRITLAVEFHKPDRFAREQIWKNLHPPKLQLDDNVNLCELARKYELTGGHIKNAWLSAIGQMVQRGGTKVMQEDLITSCSDQIIGRLSLEEFDQRIVPTCGLDTMIVADGVKDSLESIVQYTQAQTVLFGSWGFGSVHRAKTGVTALFCGPPGTGKTMAAEAISFDLGKPLMVVNLSELISKWVGETGQNIATVFDSAKSKDVVLVFDEAEGLFGERGAGSSDGVGRHDNMNVGLLLQYMESFPGVCIVITNKENLIDDAFFRRFNYVIQFERPSPTMRHKIWKTMIPKECPLSNDVDIPFLAQRYKFSGGDIKSALFHAATKAALRNIEAERMITQNDLEKACDEEEKKFGITQTGYRVGEVSDNNDFDLLTSTGTNENASRLFAAE